MAAGDVTGVYTQVKKVLLDGTLNTAGASVKVMLINAYTYSATHATITAVKAAGTESSLGGYTARGQAVASPTTGTSGTAGRLTASATIVSWTLAAGTTPTHAILYNDTGTDGTSVPILAWELGVAPNGGTYSLTINTTNGILQIT